MKNYIYEIWKPIKGFEGLYEVSNFGRVKSVGYNKSKILKPHKLDGGYFQVCLYKNKQPSHYLIHRLVAEAFIPNPDNFPCVNHKGENPSKNYVWQLEWCTYQYNNTFGNRISSAAKSRYKPIIQLSLNGEIINEFESIISIKEIGLNYKNISSVCKGKRKTANGYIWKYKGC